MLIKINKKLHLQRGISLLEVMLSLAIIAIILLLATRYYVVASRSADLNAATALIGSIQQGAAQYRVGHGTYADMTIGTLISMGSIAKSDMSGGNVVTGGGSQVTIGKDPTATAYSVVFDGSLTKAVCSNLVERYANVASTDPKSSAGCSDKSGLSITFSTTQGGGS